MADDTTTRWGTNCNSGAAGTPLPTSMTRINPYSHIPLHSDFYRIGTSIYISDPNGYDMTPDIYHFQFLGHSGDFMFMPDGTVRVFNSDLPHGELKVEFIHPGGLRWSNEVVNPTFVLTTGDGTRYTFGGYVSNIEYALSVNTEAPLNQSWSIVAFRLTRIDAPSGRSVTFSYLQQMQSSLLSQPTYSPKYDGGGNNCASQAYRHYTRTFFPVLTSVTVDGVQRIRFRYQVKTQNEDSSTYYDSFHTVTFGPNGMYLSQEALRLDSVELLDEDGTVVEQATLTPQYETSGTPKMFLSSVTTTKGGTHAFQYNLSQYLTLPKNDTQGTDHWGYWNGKYGFDPRTDVTPNADRYEQMLTNAKNPDPFYSVVGALTRITFPTGGTADIGYEGNVAESGLDEEGQIWEPLSGTFPVGGVRVRELVEKSHPSALADTSRFLYANGFLFNMPRYAFRYPIQHLPANQGDPAVPEYNVTGYNGDVDYSVSGDRFVGYADVTRIHPDHSRTETVFSSYSNGYGDGFGMEDGGQVTGFPLIMKRNVVYAGDKIYCDEYVGNPVTICASTDRRNMRGRPLSVTVRDAAGVLRQRTEYTYIADTVSLGYIYMNNVESFLAMPWKSLCAMQASETMTDYFGGQGLATVRGREYNAYGQVSCESLSSPQQPGETLRTHFVYAHEAGLSNSSIALPSALYSVAKTRTINGTRYLLAGERYTYYNFSVHIKPYQVHRFLYSSPPVISPSIPGAAPFVNLTGDQVFTFQYDPVTLFPTRVDRPGEAWTTYSWTGIHLTGRSENASDNHFSYTWQDLVGLKTLTTPAGTTETYEYDGHGRLYQVKDTDSSVVGVNHYHLTHE